MHDVISPFASLATLQATHRQLMEQRRQSRSTIEFTAEIEAFILRGRMTGAILDNRSDRWQAQNLLDYWAHELYGARRDAPDVTLFDFDPSLAPELEDEQCPYLGLDAFGIVKHSFFFGRDHFIEQMIEVLKYSRFLAIVGPSGSGKSSVAMAGLLPRLYAGALQDSKTWRYYPPMVPGTDPQANLARILQPEKADDPEWIAKTAEQLQRNPAYLVSLVSRHSGDPVVLFIDQFEEIFTFCHDDDKRRAFISSLLHLIETPKTRHVVILTMRLDVESHLVQIPALQAVYEQSQVRVAAMKAAELREAIERPAELVGLKFEENLVDELVRELLGKPEALPLLQFTLLKLWENRDHTWMTWEAYHRLGGSRQALARTADTFYDSLSPEEQNIVRQIFLEILGPTVGAEITRDRVLRQTLYEIGIDQAQVDQALEQLIETRLLRIIPGSRLAEDQVQIAHEALVRIWPRLAGWLEETRVAQRRRLRLATTAEQWETSDRNESALLRGLLLEEALNYEDLNPLEQVFVAASVAAARREQLEKEAAQQRQIEQAQALAEAERHRAAETARFARRLSRFSAALAAVFFLAVLAGAWAARNGAIAEQNARTAIANQAVAEQLRLTAEASAARAVAAQSTAQADANLRATAEADARRQQDTAERSATEANNARATAVASAAEAEAARAAAEASAAEAEAARAAAEAQTRLATARELAAAAIDQLNSDPQLGLLLALEAVNTTFAVDQTAPAEAEDALYRALQASQFQLTLAGHSDWVSDVAFSPDGARLATASFDRTIKLWDAATGQERMTLVGHSRVVNSIAFSPDGTLLASGSDDGFVIVWDAVSGERLQVINGDNGTARALAFSPDSSLLAVANSDSTVRLWEPRTGRSQFRLFGHIGPLNDVTFSHDGRLFATAGEDGRVIIWSADNGSPLYSIDRVGEIGKPAIVNGVALSPDGERLITANNDGTARLWNFRTGEMLFTLSGHTGFVFDAAFSPDGRRVATASGDSTAKVWDAQTGQALYTLSGHNGGINAIAFSPDGQRLATAGQGGTARVWNAEPGLDVLILSGHQMPVYSIAFNVAGTTVATVSDDETAKVWDAVTGSLLNSFTDHNATVRDVAFSPDGALLATVSDDLNARIWNLASGQVQLPLLRHEQPINTVAFSPDAAWLATAGEDGLVRVWDVVTSQILRQFNHHDSPVNAVAFSPDGLFLASAADDGTAVIWDLAAEAARFTLAGHNGPVNDIVFSLDGTRLATAGNDGTAKIWEVGGQALRTFSGHSGAVLSVAFSPDGTRLATASADRTAKLWNTETGQALRTLLGHTSIIQSVTFSPDGLRLATASSDGTAQINALNNIGELFERGLERITRTLTREECEQYLRGRPCLTESTH